MQWSRRRGLYLFLLRFRLRVTEYIINRCVNMIEDYFSFTYIKCRSNQSRTDLADLTFIWDIASSTFLVAPTSLLVGLIAQPPCQHLSQEKGGYDKGIPLAFKDYITSSILHFPLLPIGIFSLMAKTRWLGNAIIISTADKSYIILHGSVKTILNPFFLPRHVFLFCIFLSRRYLLISSF